MNPTIVIYDADSEPYRDPVIVTKEAVHEEELMKSDLVRLSWVSDECYVIPAGSYIIPYEDVKDIGGRYAQFVLYKDYQPERTANGYKYQPEFEHEKMWLGYTPYYFTTQDATGIVVKKTKYTFIGSLKTILTHIVNFINELYGFPQPADPFIGAQVTGKPYLIDINNYTSGSAVPSIDITQTVSWTFDGVDVLSSIADLAKACECEWHIDWYGRILHFGKIFLNISEYALYPDYIDSHHVEHVGNVGTPSVTRSSDKQYNAYLVQGSTRNNSRRTENGNIAVDAPLLLSWEYDGNGNPVPIRTTQPIYGPTDGDGNEEYPDSIIDLRPSDGGERIGPKLTSILKIDDVYPHYELYLYSLVERHKYKRNENKEVTNEQYSIWYMKLARKVSAGVFEEFSFISDVFAKVTNIRVYEQNNDKRTLNCFQTDLPYYSNYFTEEDYSVVIWIGDDKEHEYTVYAKGAWGEKEVDDIDKPIITIVSAQYDSVLGYYRFISSIDSIDNVTGKDNSQSYKDSIEITYNSITYKVHSVKTSGKLYFDPNSDYTYAVGDMANIQNGVWKVVSGLIDQNDSPGGYEKKWIDDDETKGYACLYAQNNADYSAIKTALESLSADERIIHFKSGVKGDILPSTNITSMKVDGLVPTLAMQINDAQGHQDNLLGTREFELIYHLDPVKFSEADDVVDPLAVKDENGEYTTPPRPGYLDYTLPADYYEIIKKEEGDDNLIVPTTSQQGIYPQGTYDITNTENISKNNKATIFNIVMDGDSKYSAQEELAERALEEIAAAAVDTNNYTFKSNPVAFENSNPNLSIGRRVVFTTDGLTLHTRILKLVTNLDFDFVQEITVGNSLIKGRYSQLKDEIESLQNTFYNWTAGGTGTSQSSTSDSVVYDRGLWQEGEMYYFESWNREENRMETSEVEDEYGARWQCRKNLTTQEPKTGCTDWVMVSPPTGITIKIELAGNGTLAPQETDNIHLTVQTKYIESIGGYRDISSSFTFSVTRGDGDATFAQKYANVSRVFQLPYADCFEETIIVGGHPIQRIVNNQTFTVTATNGVDTITGTFKESRAERAFQDCGEWVAGQTYALMYDSPGALSARMTPCVWHNGAKWKCLVSQPVDGVYYEPTWDSPYWELIEGNANWTIDFLSSNGYSFRRGHVRTTVSPYVFFGDADVTGSVLDESQSLVGVIAWTRTSEHPTPESEERDETWNAQHEGVKDLELTNDDMDITWSSANKQIFICTITVSDGQNTTVVQNHIIS